MKEGIFNYLHIVKTKVLKFIKHYRVITLTRANNPIPYILCIAPMWWTFALFDHLIESPFFYFILFTIGGIVTRSAGCIVNDIIDEDFDRQVERTKDRDIVSGKITKEDALRVLGVLTTIDFIIFLFLPNITKIIALIALGLSLIYPVTKRFTYYPQFFLGITINISIIMVASLAQHYNFSAIIYLYIAGVSWTMAYDTMYAYQDIDDDKRAGIKSMAIKYEDDIYSVVWKCYKISILSICALGLFIKIYALFYLIIISGVYILNLQMKQFKRCIELKDRDVGFLFKESAVWGICVFLAIFLS